MTIGLESILFYVFAAIAVIAALRVVSAKNTVHAAMYLVLVFFTVGSLWILLQAEFLALILLLVYVGAVMVLFLFIVMLLNAQLSSLSTLKQLYKIPAMFVGILIALELGGLTYYGFRQDAHLFTQDDGGVGLTGRLGQIIFTDYLYTVEIVAAILLVALVAAVTLTMRRRADAKYTDASEAVRVRAGDRILLVKMKAEKVDSVLTDEKQERK